MVEEHFEIWLSETPMSLLLSVLHHGWRRWNLMFWNTPGLNIGLILLLFGNHRHGWINFWNLTFLNAPDNIMLLLFNTFISFWLKKISKFDFLKRSRLRWPWLNSFFEIWRAETFHIGLFYYFLTHYLVEENFEFWRSQTL